MVVTRSPSTDVMMSPGRSASTGVAAGKTAPRDGVTGRRSAR